MPKSSFTPDSLPDLAGRTFVVTGGNAGVYGARLSFDFDVYSTLQLTRNSGKSTVAGLANRGARVYLGARNAEKAHEAIQDIKNSIEKPDADIVFLPLDLQRFASVREAAQLIKS